MGISAKVAARAVCTIGLAALAGCGDEADDREPLDPSTLPGSVREAFSDDQLETLDALGLRIHGGESPASVEGTFRLDSLQLVASNFADFAPRGLSYDPGTLAYADQTADRVTASTESGAGLFASPGSPISGDGDAFTVFAVYDGPFNGVDTRIARVFSGRMSDAGITEHQEAVLILDKGPDPGGAVLEVGQGRLIEETDGLAARLD